MTRHIALIRSSGSSPTVVDLEVGRMRSLEESLAQCSNAVLIAFEDQMTVGEFARYIRPWVSINIEEETVKRLPLPYTGIIDDRDIIGAEIASCKNVTFCILRRIGRTSLAWDRAQRPIFLELRQVLKLLLKQSQTPSANSIERTILSASWRIFVEQVAAEEDALYSSAIRDTLSLSENERSLLTREIRLIRRRNYELELAYRNWAGTTTIVDRFINHLDDSWHALVAALSLISITDLVSAIDDETQARWQRQDERRKSEERAARLEKRRDRQLSLFAALLIFPTLVLTYFGMESAPTSFGRIALSSPFGQLIIVGIAAMLATAGYFGLRMLERNPPENE